jgi:hypothetical protein
MAENCDGKAGLKSADEHVVTDSQLTEVNGKAGTKSADQHVVPDNQLTEVSNR